MYCNTTLTLLTDKLTANCQFWQQPVMPFCWINIETWVCVCVFHLSRGQIIMILLAEQSTEALRIPGIVSSLDNTLPDRTTAEAIIISPSCTSSPSFTFPFPILPFICLSVSAETRLEQEHFHEAAAWQLAIYLGIIGPTYARRDNTVVYNKCK